MFTGIISHTGKIINKTDNTLTIGAEKSLIERLEQGLSVSVDGICLTVVSFSDTAFTIDFMPETADKTTIAGMKEGSVVNLELPATPETFLSGHIVQGHVDGKGKLLSVEQVENSYLLKIGIEAELSKYIVTKGSIALNGISLTVIAVGKEYVTVGIIPHTWKHTNLQYLEKESYVTIEVDILGKYLEKLHG